MGWRLVGEVLDHCPDLRYRPFRLLIVLATDARDATRQSMPGHELLALRGNCSMRSVSRAMATLQNRGLIKRTDHPAPGRRAVYEILPLLGTQDNMVATERTPPKNQRRTPHSGHRSQDNMVATSSSDDCHRP